MRLLLIIRNDNQGKKPFQTYSTGNLFEVKIFFFINTLQTFSLEKVKISNRFNFSRSKRCHRSKVHVHGDVSPSRLASILKGKGKLFLFS